MPQPEEFDYEEHQEPGFIRTIRTPKTPDPRSAEARLAALEKRVATLEAANNTPGGKP